MLPEKQRKSDSTLLLGYIQSLNRWDGSHPHCWGQVFFSQSSKSNADLVWKHPHRHTQKVLSAIWASLLKSLSKFDYHMFWVDSDHIDTMPSIMVSSTSTPDITSATQRGWGKTGLCCLRIQLMKQSQHIFLFYSFSVYTWRYHLECTYLKDNHAVPRSCEWICLSFDMDEETVLFPSSDFQGKFVSLLT